ncbi:MAG TPA: ABC transporter permease [Acholeplasmataceae bacterium]|nr:ABC transporter permease [Acholeplasmataceae bacterium]
MKKFSALSKPYAVWMFILVVIPIIFMIVLSFLEFSGLNIRSAKFTLDNFSLLNNATYIKAFLKSMEYSLIATVICLLLGYPIAYIIHSSNVTNKYLILLIIILPMWSNMLLRLKALQLISLPEGFFKETFGIRFDFYGTGFAVILGMVLMYLPFMIFPIYTVLEKIDPSLLEASQDLGANHFKTFLKVTLPLSLKGVTSGVIMVFLPCAMGFTVSQIMTGGKIQLIGNIIERLFKNSLNYSLGSLISLIIIILVIGSLYIISRVDEEGETLL